MAAALDAMDEGVVVQNAKGELILFNPAALRISGITEDEMLGRKSYDPKWKIIRVDGSELPMHEHPAVIAQKTGRVIKNHIQGFHLASGELRWVSVTAAPQVDSETGEIQQVVITFRDITDERNSQRALGEKESEMGRLLNSIPALISQWDAEHRNILYNQKYIDVFGSAFLKTKNFHLSAVLGEALYARVKPFIELALKGTPQSFESTFDDVHGFTRCVLVQYIPDFRDGKVVGFFTIATDISAIKKLEQERREFESKFIAASKMSSLGEMAAGIAHEINNPLAIINGKTSQLKERIERDMFDRAKFVRDLDIVGDTVERIAKTVKGLLAFSRNAESEELKPTKLLKVIDETLDLCREKMRNRGVELRYTLEDDFVINCHANQISQILMNLLNNSFDAIQGTMQQWIAVEVTSREGFARVRVIDSGRRISDEVAAKIMQPFFTTKEIGKGTGLGLSISKGLAEKQGGSLAYDPTCENTCFVLEIPLACPGALQAAIVAGA